MEPKYHRLCGLNNRHLFFIVPEEPKVGATDSAPGKQLLSWLCEATFTLYAPMPSTRTCTERKRKGGKGGRDGRRRVWQRKRDRSVCFLHERRSYLMTHLNYLPPERSHLQIPSHQAFRQHINFGRHKHSVHNTKSTVPAQTSVNLLVFL